MNILRIQLEKTNQVWWFRWWLGDSKSSSNTKTPRFPQPEISPQIPSIGSIGWFPAPPPKKQHQTSGEVLGRILDPVVLGFVSPLFHLPRFSLALFRDLQLKHKGPRGKLIGKNPQTLRGLMWELCKKLWKRLSRPELTSNKKMEKHSHVWTFCRLFFFGGTLFWCCCRGFNLKFYENKYVGKGLRCLWKVSWDHTSTPFPSEVFHGEFTLQKLYRALHGKKASNHHSSGWHDFGSQKSRGGNEKIGLQHLQFYFIGANWV